MLTIVPTRDFDELGRDVDFVSSIADHLFSAGPHIVFFPPVAGHVVALLTLVPGIYWYVRSEFLVAATRG